MNKSIFFSTMFFIALLLNSCSKSTQYLETQVSGAAVDDYIVNANISFYKLDGTKVNTLCKSIDFGLFSCNLLNVLPNETLLSVVSGGYIDKDGNRSTLADQKPFDGSLAALSSLDTGIIISPMTSKIIAESLGIDFIVDTENNLSYINQKLNINQAQAAILSQENQTIIDSEKALLLPHILHTKDQTLIKEQATNISNTLDQNISLINSINITKNIFRLHIIHLNDTHSHLEPIELAIDIDGIKTYVYTGGYAKIAQFLEDKKAIDPQALSLIAGDSVQGTLYYTLFNGSADVTTMNLMPIDAMTIGNHEWDNGATNFADYFASKANFPIISDDIDAQNNPTLKDIIKPYIIKSIDGQKVAIVGDSIDSSSLSSPGPSIEFLNYLTSAQNSVNTLEEQGINKIIFLTHLGYSTDQFLAQQVSGIDVIVGGHSHTLIGNFSNLGLVSEGPYPTIINNDNERTLVLTSWKWGEVVGNINIVFDKDGRVINSLGTPIMLVDDTFLRKNAQGEKVDVNTTIKVKIESEIASMTNIQIQKADPAVVAVIQHYKPQVDQLMHTVIAQAQTDLVHVRLPGDRDPNTGEVLENGSMVMPHVTLSMYQKAKEVGNCDFTLQNSGGVRTSLPQGDITIGEVYTMLPFGNTLVTLEMNGSDILEMLEDSIDRSLIRKEDTGAFLYFSGAKITIDKAKPEGERIVSFQIQNSNQEWIEIDPSRTYSLATNSYIAKGHDYYSQMQNASNKVDTGFVLAEIFIQYAKRERVLDVIQESSIHIIDSTAQN